MTPLIAAATNGYADIVRLLLAVDGIHIDHQDHTTNTAFLRAASEGHTEFVDILWTAGANIHHTTKFGMSGLHRGDYRGGDETIMRLLELGFDVNHSDTGGRTPPFPVCHTGNVEAVDAILATGLVDVNATSRYDDSPIHNASVMGNVGVVEVLLAHGADVNARSTTDTTPLMLASEDGPISKLAWVAQNLLQYHLMSL